MTNTPHELAEEFPEHVQKIHDLKLSDAHFMRLAEDYHVLNRSIHRAETGTEPVSQFTEAEMRKTRMALKDEIATILSGK
ncbi:MAG: YdcH family protein [Rhodospirillaceae bacterium]|jgi:hypothetical protein|nr:YdcH family protein [Rhodospirillaceae bacterium]MBT5664472.1 YdcH family protein [Rhodospirillaceae bacterium]MBT5811448.1 YdcH family protein [Rhodospirillaceae bacterium]